MFKKRKSGLIIAAFVLLAIVVAACQPEQVEVTRVVEEEVTRVITETIVEEGETVEVTRVVTEEVVVEVPAEPVEEVMEDKGVTLHWNWPSEPPHTDPALATDNISIDIVGSLFTSLTDIDATTNDIVPRLATDWEVGEDEEGNQTWTFNLRDDTPWVNYDPATGEFTQEVDDEGNPRFVNAHDVEFGVKRTIDPATASDYAFVLLSIKNALPVNSGEEGVTLDDVGVVALDDQTIQFTLETPAPFFPAIASMWVTMPVPAWAIDAYGDNWAEPGLIVTSGPYGLEEWNHGGNLNMVKNPLWPEADSVQIDRIEGLVINEASTQLALYENNEFDVIEDPAIAELDRIKAELPDEYKNPPEAGTYYYGFVNTKYPFTDDRVRKAFSQAIDRQSLIDNVVKGGQVPATSFAPENIFGAPPAGTVGLSFDADAAAANLQSFLDDEGLTIEEFNALDIVLMHNTSENHARIAAAVQQMWNDTLGAEVRIENQEWAVYLETLRSSTPVEEAPHIFRLGWGADYNDENNWVHEVFNAEAGANRLRRACDDPNCSSVTLLPFDETTYAALSESDPEARKVLYAEAERLLTEEETAVAPIYYSVNGNLTKPWVTRNYPGIGWNDFYNWSIDVEAQQAAMGN